MNKRAAAIFLLAATLYSISSCRKRPDPVVTPDTGNLKMEFSHFVDGQPILFDSTWFLNAHGDSFLVTAFRYYISNISLIRDDSFVYTEPESYHYVDAQLDNTRKITIAGVPTGTYTSVRFMIGVDSARNVSGAQTGDLTPNNGMFWTWVTGYLNAKMEGRSPQSSEPSKYLFFHIGGYQGANAGQRWVTLPLNGGAHVRTGATPNIHYFANLNEWFRTPTVIDFSKMNEVMFESKDSRSVADNYADMFTVDHIDN